MEPPPFTSIKNRLERPHDQAFFSLMKAERAVVRLIGPRRIGKTELVAHFARVQRAPFLNIRIKPIPADIEPGPVVAALLHNEIESLAYSAAKLYRAYTAVLEKTNRGETQRSLGGELRAGFAKVVASSKNTLSPRNDTSARDPDVEITGMLRRIEQAAERAKMRPVVFFDEVQELILSAEKQSGMATVWAIRNEVQHHTACRYVFAGSNQRIFSKLQEGREAPLLNLGTALELEPLTLEEIDHWAIPLFMKGKRQVRTLASASRLLCGKIGEVVEVCNSLWAHSRPGDVLDEDIQRAAVLTVARQQEAIELAVRSLTPAQTAVLRWILLHPGISPYRRDATVKLQLNAGTVSSAIRPLIEAQLIEQFGKNRYAATTPLKLLATLTPETWDR